MENQKTKQRCVKCHRELESVLTVDLPVFVCIKQDCDNKGVLAISQEMLNKLKAKNNEG
jgi:hypothetical protein